MSQRDQGIPLETDAGIPVVDVNLFLQYEQSEQSNLKETKPEQWKQLEQQLKEECKHVAQGLHEYGVLIVKDPRVTEEDNNRYDMNKFNVFIPRTAKAYYARRFAGRVLLS